MRTTLDLPDQTFRQLKAEAALSGAKLKDFIADLIEQGLAVRAAQPTEPRTRSPLPVLRAPTGTTHPSLTTARIEDLFTADDHHS